MRLGIYFFVALILLSAAQCASACVVMPRTAAKQLPPCHQHQQKTIESCAHPVLADAIAQHAALPPLAIAEALGPAPAALLLEHSITAAPDDLPPPEILTVLRV